MSDDTKAERKRCMDVVAAVMAKSLGLPNVSFETAATLMSVGVALQGLINCGIRITDGPQTLVAPAAEPAINGKGGTT